MDGSVEVGPEGFVHGSFKTDLRQTLELHFPKRDGLKLVSIDPRRVEDLRIEATPRGPMPHIYGRVPPDAITGVSELGALDDVRDLVTGTRFCVVGFARMTLLDLVGVLDPLSRIASMEVDPEASIEVVSATDEPWQGCGARFVMSSVQPPLGHYDVLVVAGGPETRTLERDEAVIAWLRSFPANRIVASVCTGALLLGAAGWLAGKRATTHHASLDALARFGATPAPGNRVVRHGQLFTGGGVTSALDVGLALVDHIYGSDARARIAARMEYLPPP
jgi:uncharacterized protein (DUF952 family)